MKFITCCWCQHKFGTQWLQTNVSAEPLQQWKMGWVPLACFYRNSHVYLGSQIMSHPLIFLERAEHGVLWTREGRSWGELPGNDPRRIVSYMFLSFLFQCPHAPTNLVLYVFRQTSPYEELRFFFLCFNFKARVSVRRTKVRGRHSMPHFLYNITLHSIILKC